jgi:hypothetical protein
MSGQKPQSLPEEQALVSTHEPDDPYELYEYEFELREGEWEGRLDWKRWGNRSSVLCYFICQETGNKYQISGFFHDGLG